jgi:hypothetical protein
LIDPHARISRSGTGTPIAACGPQLAVEYWLHTIPAFAFVD